MGDVDQRWVIDSSKLAVPRNPYGRMIGLAIVVAVLGLGAGIGAVFGDWGRGFITANWIMLAGSIAYLLILWVQWVVRRRRRTAE